MEHSWAMCSHVPYVTFSTTTELKGCNGEHTVYNGWSIDLVLYTRECLLTLTQSMESVIQWVLLLWGEPSFKIHFYCLHFKGPIYWLTSLYKNSETWRVNDTCSEERPLSIWERACVHSSLSILFYSEWMINSISLCVRIHPYPFLNLLIKRWLVLWTKHM